MYIPSSIETKKMIEAGSKKARDDITGPGQNPTIPQPTPNKPDKTPTAKLRKSNKKISTFTWAIGR